MTTLLIFVALIGLILLGVPVAVSMGLTAVATFLIMGQADILTMVAQRMYASTTSFTLLAIPFFILAGNLMNTGGITERIFRFARGPGRAYLGRPGAGQCHRQHDLFGHVGGCRGRCGRPGHDRNEGHEGQRL